MIHVAVLTTWGSKCGISTYSEELYECLIDTGEVKVQILAPMEEGSCMHAPEGIPYRMLWNRGDPNLPINVPSAVRDCQVVHIQHEYGLFQHHESLIKLLRFLRRDGIKTVITLHTVFPYGTWRGGVLDSLRGNTDALIVHTPEAYAMALLSRGKGRVFCVSHGTREKVVLGDRDTGCDFLGIPKRLREASFGGSIGFISPSKNLQETIKAWSEGANRGLIDPSNNGFIIVGDIDERVLFYQVELSNLRRDCGYAENIFIVYKFIPRDMMRHVMSVFDYAVLNTTSDHVISASGQVHALAAHGIPFAVAERPIYRDAIGAGAIPFPLTSNGNNYTITTVDVISALASNKELQDTVKASVKKYAHETGWSKQAARHLQIYKEILQ